jgi:hypothetical protein
MNDKLKEMMEEVVGACSGVLIQGLSGGTKKRLWLKDGGGILFRTVGTHPSDYTVSYPRKQQHEFNRREHIIKIKFPICMVPEAPLDVIIWHVIPGYRFTPCFSQVRSKRP